MASSNLPVDTLPVWASLNNVHFSDVKVGALGEKGQGIVSTAQISETGDAADPPVLLKVPHEVILCEDVLDGYAKGDKRLKGLFDAMGPQSSLRIKTLAFLLSQRVHAALSSPWTEYVRYLPHDVFVPTMWHDHELPLLHGTSLEPAVNAKLTELTREYDHFREASEELPSWETVWGNRSLSLRDWILADAWYRSRSLDLPRSGISLVPVIDMANHSPTPMARYDETDDHEATLVLRHDASIAPDDEVTITYGADKSAAEILFSYGFIDTQDSQRRLVLPVPALDDDPLLRAKLYSFGRPPTAEFWLHGAKPLWKSPFAHFMCLNEEDGLDFRTLQEVSGERQLKVFWQDQDVTDHVDDFEQLAAGHPLGPLFRLRVVTVVEELAGLHLSRMREAAASAEDDVLREVHGAPRRECAALAGALRDVESMVLEAVLVVLQEEKTELLKDKSVKAYLGSMDPAESEQVAADLANEEEEDFS